MSFGRQTDEPKMSTKWAPNHQTEPKMSFGHGVDELKMSFSRQTDEPKMSSRWALAVQPMSQKWAHEFAGWSSFWARFWLIGLKAKAHFELILSSSVQCAKLILGFTLGSFGLTATLILSSLVWRAKVVLGSFCARWLRGLSSFWRSFWFGFWESLSSFWVRFRLVGLNAKAHFWSIFG